MSLPCSPPDLQDSRVDVLDGAHVLLIDGSTCRVTFHPVRGVEVVKEGQLIADLSFSELSSLASYADYPAAHIVQKIAHILEPGEMTREHRDALVISVREWLRESRRLAAAALSLSD